MQTFHFALKSQQRKMELKGTQVLYQPVDFTVPGQDLAAAAIN